MYTTIVKASGGRNGRVTSDDGLLDFQIKIPRAIGGPGGNFTNPEQLFAAGYAACFDTALQFVIVKEGLKQKESFVEAAVSIERSGLVFDLSVKLKIFVKDVEPEVVKQLVEKAHQICPYSKAIRGNIPVELVVCETEPAG